jgi:lipoprotein NlpD
MKTAINYILLSIVLLFSLSQVGCVSETAAAPISMVIAKSELSSGYYKVHAGDTLYSIAWAYNLDYRKLARYNRLSNNAILNVGEVIRLNDSVKRLRRGGYKKKVSVFYSNVDRKNQNKTHYLSSSKLVSPKRWIWPTKGKVIERFSRSASGNKGLNIAGKYGQPVHSSAKGVIVYCGVGVRGYGSLIIVKHSRDFLSAYANNSVILVKLGQRVKAGQLIAKMGRTNAGNALLHFEIRYDGNPVNPAKYLG